MLRLIVLIIIGGLVGGLPASVPRAYANETSYSSDAPMVSNVRISHRSDTTQIILDLTDKGNFSYSFFETDTMLTLDLPGVNWQTAMASNQVIGLSQGYNFSSAGDGENSVDMIFSVPVKVILASSILPNGAKGHRFILQVEALNKPKKKVSKKAVVKKIASKKIASKKIASKKILLKKVSVAVPVKVAPSVVKVKPPVLEAKSTPSQKKFMITIGNYALFADIEILKPKQKRPSRERSRRRARSKQKHPSPSQRVAMPANKVPLISSAKMALTSAHKISAPPMIKAVLTSPKNEPLGSFKKLTLPPIQKMPVMTVNKTSLVSPEKTSLASAGQLTFLASIKKAATASTEDGALPALIKKETLSLAEKEDLSTAKKRVLIAPKPKKMPLIGKKKVVLSPIEKAFLTSSEKLKAAKPEKKMAGLSINMATLASAEKIVLALVEKANSEKTVDSTESPPTNIIAQSLEDALVAAYLNNPTLDAERVKLRIKDEGVTQAFAGWRPTLKMSGTYANNAYSTNTSVGTDRHQHRNQRSLSLTISQSLYKGGRTQAAISSAENTVLASRYNMVNVEQSVLLSALNAYVKVYRDTVVLALNKKNEQVLEARLEATQEHFKIGETTRTDVSQAQARLSRAAADRFASEGNLEVTRATYLQVIGSAPGDLTAPEVLKITANTKQEAISAALSANPQVLAAEATKKTYEDNVKKTRGELLPSMDLSGTASRSFDTTTENSRIDDYKAQVTVTVPIYQAGAVYSRLRSAKHQIVYQQKIIDQTRRTATEGAIRAWESLQSTLAQIESIKLQVKASTIALEGVQSESAIGSRTVLDILDAEQELLDANVSMTKAKGDKIMAIYALKKAMGTLTAKSLNLPVRIYDPSKV